MGARVTGQTGSPYPIPSLGPNPHPQLTPPPAGTWGLVPELCYFFPLDWNQTHLNLNLDSSVYPCGPLD